MTGSDLEVSFALPREMPWTERPRRWVDGDNGWTPAEEAQYLRDLKTTIEAGWNATPAPIRCVKPGWERFVAVPRIEVNPFAAGEGKVSPHYQVEVCKDGHEGLGNYRPPVSEPRFGLPGEVSVDENQLEDDLSIAAVQDEEVARIVAALPSIELTPVTGGGWEISPNGRDQVDRFAEALNDAMPSMYRPHLWREGWSDVEESREAGTLVIERLKRQGVTNELSGTSRMGGSNEPGTVTVDFPPSERTMQWPIPKFNMVLHEFGHMLGLSDEYAIADEEGHGMEKKHRELLDRSGVDQHPVDASTTSVMANGKDVLPAHYVTMWEAVTEMTAAFVGASQWKL